MAAKRNGRPTTKPVARTYNFEHLEQRIALTAQAVTDVPTADAPADVQPVAQTQITTMLADTNQASGVDYVRENYGFDGSGQTVAVIDSGIAWDHYALGGGYGSEYRVVGGWDFAENDANPYDDGPAGYHGTHVSGIIGSSDSEHTGVASGVDLVSLRVFNDNGQSEFAWIEQALQWVHEHKDDFANPITTVNLSLGTAWNADTVPQWATLENEFAQLEADGIFISVAAGNSFKNYNSPGVSYPAASPHVTPVASHGSDGQLSDFSQRNQNVLVAPGENIYSTVPDHLYMGLKTGQFLKASGTSMAAPYLAGASTLVREASSFMGVENLTQDDIYQHFHETATRIYDSVTNAWYDRIDVQAAINSIVTDLHGGAWSQATDLGTLQAGEDGNLTANGTIGKFSDVDVFEFTAEQSGNVTLTFEQTHDLQTEFKLNNRDFQINGNQIAFDVVAGESYQFSMATLNGIGHYEINLSLAAQNNDGGAGVFEPIGWGIINDTSVDSFPVNGEQWFNFEAGKNGLMTVLANSGSSGLQYEVYDQNLNLIASGGASNQSGLNHTRIDFNASAGQEYFLKVVGNSDSVETRLVNLVGLNDQLLSVDGTENDDSIVVRDGESLTVVVNGVDYNFVSSAVHSITVDGLSGHDDIRFDAGAGDDVIVVSPEGLSVANESFKLSATGFESQTVNNMGGGNDQVTLLDSAGNDRLVASANSTTMSSNGYINHIHGFEQIQLNATRGYDMANFQGSNGVDIVEISGNNAELNSGTSNVKASGFDFVRATGGSGNDQLIINGTENADRFVFTEHQVTMTSNASRAYASGFERVEIDGGGGYDRLTIRDTRGNDIVEIDGDNVALTGSGMRLEANNIEGVTASSSSGYDQLKITGRESINVTLAEDNARLKHGNLEFDSNGFSRVMVNATQSNNDSLTLIGSGSIDRLYWIGDQTIMVGNGYYNRTVGFENISVDGNGGYDTAIIYGSSRAETFRMDRDSAEWESDEFHGKLQGFERFTVNGRGGEDRVELSGFDQGDRLSGRASSIHAYLNDQNVSLRDFEKLSAHTNPFATSDEDLQAVDYLFDLHGDWD